MEKVISATGKIFFCWKKRILDDILLCISICLLQIYIVLLYDSMYIYLAEYFYLLEGNQYLNNYLEKRSHVIFVDSHSSEKVEFLGGACGVHALWAPAGGLLCFTTNFGS